MNVLLVDDEPSIARAFTKVLEGAGFKVTSAASAAEAESALKGTEFHALVLDFILPGAEGTTFYDYLASNYPRMAERVLFVTGWAGDPKSLNLIKHTGKPVLAKPVALADLVAAVQKIALPFPD